MNPEALVALVGSSAVMFIAGGIVKGALGVGLPLVVVPLLSLILPTSKAIGLLVMPVILSNFLQAFSNGRFSYTLRRFTPLLIAQLIATLLANHWGAQLSPSAMNIVMALSVVVAVAMMALQPKGDLSPRQEKWGGPIVGFIAGSIGGASSLTGPVLITYLMALKLTRDEFVGSISIIYLLGSVPMYMAMFAWGRFEFDVVLLSCLALGPVYIGLRLGGVFRSRMSETGFRKSLFVFLTLLSIVLLLK
jgi:uncharacterized membrane protein YfcA